MPNDTVLIHEETGMPYVTAENFEQMTGALQHYYRRPDASIIKAVHIPYGFVVDTHGTDVPFDDGGWIALDTLGYLYGLDNDTFAATYSSTAPGDAGPRSITEQGIDLFRAIHKLELQITEHGLTREEEGSVIREFRLAKTHLEETIQRIARGRAIANRTFGHYDVDRGTVIPLDPTTYEERR
jgi:hypothetical protein